MKTDSLRSLTAAMMAVMFAAAALASDAAAKKVRWSVHSAFAPDAAVLGEPPHRIAAWLDTMSDGEFELRVFEPGALAGSFSYYDAVSRGAIDAAYGTPGANQSKNSAYSFFSSWPFGPRAPEFLAWLHHGGGIELARELYARDNIMYHLCGMIPPETSGWFRSEVKSLADFKGLKMRIFGLGAKVMRKFGVSTQKLSGGDIYPALEGGKIDAAEFSMPAADRSLGFHQIAKHNYFPGWHQQSSTAEFLVNMDRWNALSEQQKAMFETACMAQTTLQIAEGEAAQFEAVQANQADGVIVHRWPQEILDELRVAWDRVIFEETAANPDSKRVWESITAFRDRFKVWADLGYLE